MSSTTLTDPPTASQKQRIDKWLWFARCVKTRTLAAKLVVEGHVRINGQRVVVPARTVVAGDHLTIALERQTLVWEVLGTGTRRGPFMEAKLLYKDLTPNPDPQLAPEPKVAERNEGSGRPTKKQRRAMERFESPDD